VQCTFEYFRGTISAIVETTPPLLHAPGGFFTFQVHIQEHSMSAKPIPGFSGDVKPAFVPSTNGGAAKTPVDNRVTTGSNGKGNGFPKNDAMIPSKV
jgi:hypothetical protein